MKFSSFLNFFKKTDEQDESGRFSDFFQNASAAQKEKVFREAARRANEDQRALLKKSELELKSR
ncbi:hypothetical protein A2627_00275 [Candidatus Woesebacteria bacterium RIFCSPHIGHO2_01_FULL_39_28]|uniref:Uncharacterized protein n=1 Tax=Candidatus Woesebacteria bacterium RIFCSPHIGHO2_01_FULL_39_28 TaxID=1802496 RepID=A0A1F7YCN7_9BACT|nr:MAG: hypothetical protein A3B95_01045 [Candidatus Doudnabacteria bacterium RIFCSPHIGHO2_02_FULL_43_13b]OGM24398.1 MAG: hypothetical protein A2627_00275 [Candidatus Woesebacteria bacterium RIFCSPHIGHO2_01_FULL_39_28]